MKSPLNTFEAHESEDKSKSSVSFETFGAGSAIHPADRLRRPPVQHLGHPGGTTLQRKRGDLWLRLRPLLLSDLAARLSASGVPAGAAPLQGARVLGSQDGAIQHGALPTVGWPHLGGHRSRREAHRTS